MRLENTVRLHGTAEGTSVLVDGDLALAGALGSVGQKVVARQAGKVTAEFAANLQRALSGEGPVPARPGTSREVPGVPPVQAGAVRTARWPGSPPGGPRAPGAPDRWGKVAVALSGVSAVLSVVILIRQRRGQ
jgi:hypothetical protein